MKRCVLLLTVVALALATNLRAEEESIGASGGLMIVMADGAVPAGGNPGGVFLPGGGGKSAAQWHIASIDKVVNLTDAQKKKITELIEARDKAMRDFQTQSAEQLKAAGNAIMEAYKGKDKDVIAKAQKEYQELYAPMHQIMKKSQDALSDVLTAEQKTKLDDSRAMDMLKGMTAPAQLSEEQVKKFKAIYSEMMKRGDHESREGKFPAAIQQLLTPEQQMAIAKHRATSYVKAIFGQIKLTADQLQQIEAACDEIAKGQTDKAGWDMPAYNKVVEKVRGMLTDEQKAAMKRPLGNVLKSGGGAPNPGAATPAKPNPDGVKVIQVGPGQFQAEIQLAPQGEGARGQRTIQLGERRTLVLAEEATEGQAYWLGLQVETEGGVLVVEAVLPDSPAAKAGIKAGDLIKRVNRTSPSTVAELAKAVQDSNGETLAIELIRDAKTQTVKVKPGKRGEQNAEVREVKSQLETVLKKAHEAQSKETPKVQQILVPKVEKQPNVEVKRLPDGGIQVIIKEAAEGKQGEAAEKAQMERREQQARAEKAVRAQMRDKVKRQHELAEKAWQICQKLDAIGEGKSYELWEQLEQVEGQLRQTFEPAARVNVPRQPGAQMPGAPINVDPQRPNPYIQRPGAAMPGAPAGGGAPDAQQREAIVKLMNQLIDKAARMEKEGKANEARGVKHEAMELQEAAERLQQARAAQATWTAVGQPLNPQPGAARPDPAIQELRGQVQDLRRQMEEIKALLKKTRDRD